MVSLRSRSLLAALALSVSILGAPAFGQDARAREGRLTYGIGLDYDFDVGLEVVSDIGLTLITRTRSTSLEFNIATELFGNFTDSGTDDFDFRDNSVGIVYSRDGANSALLFSAGYSERNLEDDVVDSIVTDGGEVTTLQFSGSVETGIEGPFGVKIDASYRDRDFTAADPSLVDDTVTSLEALARFSLSRSTSLRARAGLTRTDEDDAAGTETVATYFGLGVATETAGGLDVTGDLLFDRSEETTSMPAASNVEDGVGFELAVTRAMPNGSIGGSLNSRIDDVGRRSTLTLMRSIDTKTGEFAFSVGVLDQENVDDLQVIGGLTYSVEGPRNAFSASLTREANTRNDATVVQTGLELAYRQQINAISDWEATLGYREIDELGSSDDDARTTAGLSYTRNLTDEWSMSTGYKYSKDEGEDAENSVFFNIRRDITFGF
ncbi:MAG: hypothetical protein LJE62_01495 [Silicimonas sp.]|jgi:hypothetical protein|nr:hypothetical protein [Silicimonas sp.]